MKELNENFNLPEKKRHKQSKQNSFIRLEAKLES